MQLKRQQANTDFIMQACCISVLHPDCIVYCADSTFVFQPTAGL